MTKTDPEYIYGKNIFKPWASHSSSGSARKSQSPDSIGKQVMKRGDLRDAVDICIFGMFCMFAGMCFRSDIHISQRTLEKHTCPQERNVLRLSDQSPLAVIAGGASSSSPMNAPRHQRARRQHAQLADVADLIVIDPRMAHLPWISF